MFVLGRNKQLAGSLRCSDKSENSDMVMSLLCVRGSDKSLGFDAASGRNPCRSHGSIEKELLLCRVNLEIQLHSTRPVGIMLW